MARIVIIFLACAIVVLLVLAQRYQTLAHPHYKTIVSIVVHAHAHHQTLAVPTHQ